MSCKSENKNKKSVFEASSHKKNEVLGSKKSKTKSASCIIFSAIAVLAIAAVVIFRGNALSPQDQRVAETLKTGGAAAKPADVVIHPIGLFDDGKVKHFEFKAQNGIIVRYFVLRSSDGVIRSAFDACDVCWPSGKGYYQEGDNMVCGNCGKRFASVKINEIKGGCNPAPLARKTEGDKLLIRVSDIREGASYFDFKGRISS